MKVLFIHNRYQHAGGEDTVVNMEMDVLNANGHEIELLQFDNALISGLKGKISGALKAIYNPGSARILEQKIKSFRPDIIHVHNLFFEASPSVLFKAKAMGIPVVATLHNFRLICAKAMLLREGRICEACIHSKLPLTGIIHKCYRDSRLETGLVTAITGIHKYLNTWNSKVDFFITPSAFMREKITSGATGIDAAKIITKPNFITDPGQGDADRVDQYLYAGRLSHEKGILQLATHFSKRESGKLVIAGDGPLRDQIIGLAANSERLEYVGMQLPEMIIRQMRSSRALIFPSVWYEGMPMTIIEALATGTPVIASALGAMKEMIRDGENGFLFEPGNMASLDLALKKIDNEQDKRMYRGARESYLQQYTPEVHFGNILKIYKQLSNGQHKSSSIAKPVDEYQHQHAEFSAEH